MQRINPVKYAQRRLMTIIAIFIIVSSGIALSLYYASDNIVFFIKPSDLSKEYIGQKIRIGGLVMKGSIRKMPNRVIAFTITDNHANISVTYRGIVPSLFREEQGIVVEGVFTDLKAVFVAEKLLTKHDENYKPPGQGKEL